MLAYFAISVTMEKPGVRSANNDKKWPRELGWTGDWISVFLTNPKPYWGKTDNKREEPGNVRRSRYAYHRRRGSF